VAFHRENYHPNLNDVGSVSYPQGKPIQKNRPRGSAPGGRCYVAIAPTPGFVLR